MFRERYATAGVTFFRRFFHTDPATTTWWIVLGLILTTSLRAQEPVRSSAPPSRIDSFRQTPEAFFYLGPFQEELVGSLGVQYVDNVNLTPTDKISNLSFSLGMTLNTTWVISHLNQLTFNFGGAIVENIYSNGRSQLNFSIAPNSMLEFKFDIGDYRVRLFDRFSYVQNPTTNPTATNTANANNLTNTFGAVIDKDFNVVVLSLLADYTFNTQSGTNSAGQNNPTTSGNRQSFRVGPALTLRLSPTILYGVNAVATRSSSAGEANVNSLNFGPFINGKLSRNFEFELAGGGTIIRTEPPIQPSYYVTANLRYLINRHWQLLFAASHQLVFTTGTDLTEENLIKLGTQLDLTRLISFTLSPFVNWGDVETNTQSQGTFIVPNNQLGPYTLYGIEAGLTWRPRKRWSTELVYNFIRRESSTASSNYTQNAFTFQINYTF
jgi:hypothetical protein